MATTKFTAQNLDPNATTGIGDVSFSSIAITASSGGFNKGSSALVGTYSESGGKVTYHGRLLVTTGGAWNAGTGIWYFNLPVVAATTLSTIVGSAHILDSGTKHYSCVCEVDTTNQRLVIINEGNTASGIGATDPVTWATSDLIEFTVTYPKT